LKKIFRRFKSIRLINKINWKLLTAFFVFELVFSAITMPLAIFYGPFENVKKTIVGMAWSTFSHQYYATSFLSQEAIERILSSSGYYGTDTVIDDQGNVVTQPDNKPVEDFTLLDTDNFTRTGKIEIATFEGPGFVGKAILINDPKRVKLGVTGKLFVEGETTSSIAKRLGAVAAINAGGHVDSFDWIATGATPDGLVYSGGALVQDYDKNDNLTYSVAFINDKDVLVVGEYKGSEIKKMNIRDGVTFTPPLIINGKPQLVNDGGWGIAPRTAIGQRADGTIILMVIDGRDWLRGRIGALMSDIQNIMLNKFNAINAVNLDGGSSSTMFFNGKLINRPADAMGERYVPTAFIVLPEGEAKK